MKPNWVPIYSFDSCFTEKHCNGLITIFSKVLFLGKKHFKITKGELFGSKCLILNYDVNYLTRCSELGELEVSVRTIIVTIQVMNETFMKLDANSFDMLKKSYTSSK
jgi:hypothetical protein